MTLQSPVITRTGTTASTVSMSWPKVDGAGKYWIYQTLPQPPYNTVSGVKAAYFDGSGDYLTITGSSDFNFGSGNFTIDLWAKSSGTQASSAAAFTLWLSESYYIMLRLDGSSLSTAQIAYGSAQSITLGSSYPSTSWQHYALVKSGNTFTCYVDGISKGSLTVTGSSGQYSQLVIGAARWNTNYTSFKGYIDEFRISKGIARWTSNFDVPTSPYETDQYTKLLLHTNGTGNTFVDDSGTGKTITAYGNATQLIAPQVPTPRWEITATPSGQNSAYFDGNGDYLSLASSSDWAFGTSDFTIDFWMKSNVKSLMNTYWRTIVSSGNADYRPIYISILDTTGAIVIQNTHNGGAIISGTIDVTTGDWKHVALIRNNGTLKLYINGILNGQIEDSTDYSGSYPLYIGTSCDNVVNGHYSGYIDELRISKGIARWTENFTPSTTPYATDEHTKLLLHMQGPGNTFVDSSGTNKAITATGNVVKTPLSPFVTEAVYETGVATGLNLGTENKFKVTAGFATDCAPAGGTGRRTHVSILYGNKMISWGGYNGSNLATVDIYDLLTNTWSTGTAGGTARSSHSGDLWNGKLYAWGGSSGSAINTLSIYDIASNSWTTGAAGGTARYGHTCSIYNGKMYCWGGTSNGSDSLNTLNIYDVATNTWSSGATGGTGRRFHTANVYNGKIYFWGGRTPEYINTVDIYDITSNTWSSGTAGGTARYGHASIIYGDKMYCWGGANSSRLNTMDIYDLVANTWSTGSAGGSIRELQTSICYEGKMYIWGGIDGSSYLNTVDIYDIASNTWNYRATPRAMGTADIYNGKIYVFGGSPSYSTASYYNIMDIYDIATGTWSQGATAPVARRQHASACLNGKIYYYAGYNGSYLNSLSIYDIASNTWSSGPSYGTARVWIKGVASNNKVYFYGGYNSTGTTLGNLDIYDPSTNTWSSGTTGTARCIAALTEYQGKIYGYAGYNGSTVVNTLHIYDTVANSWTSGSSFGTAKQELCGIAYNGRLYFEGGSNLAGSGYYTELCVYDIASNTWYAGPAGPSRWIHAAVVSGNKMLIIGGAAGGSAIRTMDSFDLDAHTWTTSYVESPMSNEITSVTNTSPLVTITTSTGQKRILGEPITFTGYAQDVEDGNSAITSNAVWTSSIDGVLGTGDTVSHQLSEGTHTITYTATDSGGLYDSKQITMQITPAKIIVTGGKIMLSNGKVVALFSS